MRAAPRPANISTNDAADWEKNSAPDSPATAFASSVLPVPGGPWSRMPFGTLRARARGTAPGRAGTRRPPPARPWPRRRRRPRPTSPTSDDSGLICCGLVLGISFSVRQMKTTIRNMKMIGAQVMISGSRRFHSYQCDSGTLVVAGCADELDGLARTPVGAFDHASAVCPAQGAVALGSGPHMFVQLALAAALAGAAPRRPRRRRSSSSATRAASCTRRSPPPARRSQRLDGAGTRRPRRRRRAT